MQNESEIRLIAMSRILEPSHRLRETIDPEKLGALADSIAAEGLHQPIGVRGPLDADTYEIVWGHRRFLACKLLKHSTIAAKVFDPDFDPLLAAVSENLNREQLNPLEEARAVARFVERGEPDAAIARLFRRSPAWVNQRRQLLTYPADVQLAVQSGELTLGVAAALADVNHDGYRAELVAEAIRTGATVRTADVWRAHFLADRDRIVKNMYTIQQIVERRDAWTIKVPCDMCRGEFDYQGTTSVRVCMQCHRELLEAIREMERERINGQPETP